jgi:hypothetical protein
MENIITNITMGSAKKASMLRKCMLNNNLRHKWVSVNLECNLDNPFPDSLFLDKVILEAVTHKAATQALHKAAIRKAATRKVDSHRGAIRKVATHKAHKGATKVNPCKVAMLARNKATLEVLVLKSRLLVLKPPDLVLKSRLLVLKSKLLDLALKCNRLKHNKQDLDLKHSKFKSLRLSVFLRSRQRLQPLFQRRRLRLTLRNSELP